MSTRRTVPVVSADTSKLIDEAFDGPAVWVGYAVALGQPAILHQLEGVAKRFQPGDGFGPQQHGIAAVEGMMVALKEMGGVTPGRSEHAKYGVQSKLVYLVGAVLAVLAVRDYAAILPPKDRVISKSSMDELERAFERAMTMYGCEPYVHNTSWATHAARVDAALKSFQPSHDDGTWFWENVIDRLPNGDEVAHDVIAAFHTLTPAHVAQAYSAAYYEHHQGKQAQ